MQCHFSTPLRSNVLTLGLPARCCVVLLDYRARIEGPSDDRFESPTAGRPDLGSCHARHVQFPAEGVQDKEWWLPILSASVLIRVDSANLDRPVAADAESLHF